MSFKIPVREAARVTFFQAFSDEIGGNFAAYHLLSGDATTISTAVSDFATAYLTANTPTTRTKASITAKNTAMDTALTIVKKYGYRIEFDNTISDELKAAVGIVPNNPKTPIAPPDAAPIIAVIGATTGSQTLQFQEIEDGTSEPKPEGVTNIQIFRVIGTAPVTDHSDATYYGAFRKNPMGVEFEHADDGKVATYFARWADAKGQVGPWSLPTSMRIAA